MSFFVKIVTKNVGCFLSVALSDPSSRLSTSPPPPAIAVPLLEMGFSLRQITKALEATGQAHKSSKAKSVTHRYYSGCLWYFRCSRGSRRPEHHGSGHVDDRTPRDRGRA